MKPTVARLFMFLTLVSLLSAVALLRPRRVMPPRIVQPSRIERDMPAVATTPQVEIAAQDPIKLTMPASPVQIGSRTVTPDVAYRPEFAAEKAECYVQFSSSPTPEDWQRYEESGVARHTYVCEGTWRVEATPQGIETLAGSPATAGFAKALPADKLSAETVAGVFVAPLPGGKARMAVEFDPATSAVDRARIVQAHGGNIEAPINETTEEVVLPIAQLEGLASEPAVIGASDSSLYPLKTCNLAAAMISRVHLVQNDGQRGANVRLAIVDEGRVLDTHQELTGRVTPGDLVGFSNHATHVAGTMIASGGYAPAKGMAPMANLLSFDWNNNFVDFGTAVANSAVAVNNSYSRTTGWNQNPITLVWTDYMNTGLFGAYTLDSRMVDQRANASPMFNLVFAAGNDRTDGNAGTHDGTFVGPAFTSRWSTADGPIPANAYADLVSSLACAKNGLAVGALTDNLGMTTFSSWGPANDSRIKPDLVANGFELTSPVASATNNYAISSGTSMAAPVVTGSLALLVEKYRLSHGGANPRSDLLRAAVLHTVTDWAPNGYPGPDFMSGFGLLDTKSAADLIGISQRYVEGASVTEGTSRTYAVNVAHVNDLRLISTLSWNDPAAAADAPTALVNDLDLELISPFGDVVHTVWKLNFADPTAPATRGTNRVDVNEKARLDNPMSGAWRLRVNGYRVPVGGTQLFSLVTDRSIVTRYVTFSGNLREGKPVTIRVNGNANEPYQVIISKTLLASAGTKTGWSGSWWLGAADRTLSGNLNPSGYADVVWTPGIHLGTTTYIQAAIGPSGTGTAAALTIAPIAVLPGDGTGDGKVDASDYLIWRKGMGRTGTPLTQLDGDYDGNGVVNQADYNVWRANFGRTLPLP